MNGQSSMRRRAIHTKVASATPLASPDLVSSLVSLLSGLSPACYSCLDWDQSDARPLDHGRRGGTDTRFAHLTLPRTTMTLLQTYAPTVALIALTFFVVRGLAYAIWSTLLRPSKNVKKYVSRETTTHEAANGKRDNDELTSLSSCLWLPFSFVRVNGPLLRVSADRCRKLVCPHGLIGPSRHSGARTQC